MMVWAVEYDGWWPIGSCMVVTAHNVEEAEELFVQLFREVYGAQRDHGELMFTAISTTSPNAVVILDGNY